MAFFAGRRRGLVVGAVVGAKVASNRAHAQEQQHDMQRQQKELEEQKQKQEYEKKLKEQEERYKKQLEEEKKKNAQPQFHNNPAQMTYAYQPIQSGYSQPIPAGVQPASLPPGPPPVLGAPPKLVKARVLAPYDARSASELSISIGEEVIVINRDVGGWAQVSNLSGKSGFVPPSYLQFLA